MLKEAEFKDDLPYGAKTADHVLQLRPQYTKLSRETSPHAAFITL